MTYPQSDLPEGRDYEYDGDLLRRRDDQTRLATRFLERAKTFEGMVVMPLHFADRSVRCFYGDYNAGWACNNRTFFLALDVGYEQSHVTVPACVEHLGYAVVYASSIPQAVRDGQ